MADEKRPDVFGDGSTREQQDALIKEHDEINEQLHKAAQAQREYLGGAAEQSQPVEQSKPAAQPEQKAEQKAKQPAT